MELESIIGIEIHVQLKTSTKMFSRTPATFGLESNTQILPLDMGLPGTLPLVNKKAVILAIKICSALNMEIAHTLYFDRKNYFYPDLPKGYQITQQFNPIGKNGHLELLLDSGEKLICHIDNAHLEEDTAKQIHLDDSSFVNYNRAGIPLLEIVSNPDMHSGEEAMKYVETIREIVTYLNASDGKMEDGSLRCDINISLREKGSKKLGTKCEIKNLNSIQNIKDAVDYEINRQKEIILSNNKVESETRRYDEKLKQTVLLRKKTKTVDYKYFREPNIIPIDLDEGLIYDAIHTMNKLPSEYRVELASFGLNNYEITELLRDQSLTIYYEELVKLGADSKILWNYLLGDIKAYLNKNETNVDSLKFSKNSLVSFVSLIKDNKINSKQAKEILEIMINTGKKPDNIIKEKGIEQINSTSDIEKIVDEVISSNSDAINQYKNGKDHAFSYLVGQVMKLSKGKANPNIAKDLLISKIGNFFKK